MNVGPGPHLRVSSVPASILTSPPSSLPERISGPFVSSMIAQWVWPLPEVAARTLAMVCAWYCKQGINVS